MVYERLARTHDCPQLAPPEPNDFKPHVSPDSVPTVPALIIRPLEK